MSTIKQRTFYVDGQKIQIKSRPQSYAGNFSGWYVFVNGKKHFVNVLERETAEDVAFIKWIDTEPFFKE